MCPARGTPRARARERARAWGGWGWRRVGGRPILPREPRHGAHAASCCCCSCRGGGGGGARARMRARACARTRRKHMRACAAAHAHAHAHARARARARARGACAPAPGAGGACARLRGGGCAARRRRERAGVVHGGDGSSDARAAGQRGAHDGLPAGHRRRDDRAHVRVGAALQALLSGARGSSAHVRTRQPPRARTRVHARTRKCAGLR